MSNPFARLRSVSLATTLVVACLTSRALAGPQDETKVATKSFDERIAAMDKLLEAARVENKIPGLAIAVVKDDKIVFAKGYGMSNLEAKTAVKPETRFAIGSSTKAFTSAIVGMMVDEGKMSWDDPVSKHIPDYKMKVETEQDKVTLRDLLCHRTGFTRMGMIWAGGTSSRADVIKMAANAEPYAGFREKFLYNNVTYMTAGFSAGRVSGSDWETLVAERIFKPLGMKHSDTSIKVAQKAPEMSLGYVWDEEDKKHKHLPMRDLTSIGPSGSINSSVLDMTQWIRLQLGKGEFEGKRLISEESIAEMWKKQIEIGGGVDYGFGWMLQDWNGKKVVEHGGNIDGFSAQVTLLPEMNAGYVLLANVTVTPLQGRSVGLVFDSLFGEAKKEGSMDGVETKDLIGTYIANFGPFTDGKFEVKLNEKGKLAVDVPGQQLFELKSPDETGKWFFALTDTIAVSFNKDDNDKVASITLHQGGMAPEFLREGGNRKAESPLSVTGPLVGKYRDEKTKSDVEVAVKNGRLTVMTKRQGTFVFMPPKEGEDKWNLRARPQLFQMRFNKNDDGTIKSMTRIQGGNEVEMPRIKEEAQSPAKKIPSNDELLAMMRKANGTLKKNGTAAYRMTGTVNLIHQGATGTIEMSYAADGKQITRQDFGKLARITEGFDGERGVSDASIGQREELKGEKLKLLKLAHPLWFHQKFEDDYDDISITDTDEVDGKKVYVATFAGKDVPTRKLYVDQKTGMLLREKTVRPADTIGRIPLDITYGDYRKVGGVMMPFKITSDNPFSGSTEMTFEKAEELKTVAEGFFIVPPRAEK